MVRHRAGRARRRRPTWIVRLAGRLVVLVSAVLLAGFAFGLTGSGSGSAAPSQSAADRLGSFARDGVVVLLAVGAAMVLLIAAPHIYRRIRGRRIEDWQDAEAAAAEWLRRAGCRGVSLTGAGADGGIDVISARWAAQVKHTAKKVGRPAVQQLVGAALALERSPVLFSTGGFTTPARRYADEHRVALVELSLDGRARRMNRPAHEIGRHRRWPFTLRFV